MEIVTAIVTPVVDSLMVPVKKHLGYMVSCATYVTSMHTKMGALSSTRPDVEERVKGNNINNLRVPTQVKDWLEEVEKIDAQVKSIDSNVGSCFNLKGRHKLGRKAYKIIQDIDRLNEEKSRIDWTDHPIPLGQVDSMKETTSTPSSHYNDFKSRETTFLKALKALQPDHKSHMIALCGMGGVGKTIMMQKLKKVVSEKKIFDFIIEVAIGQKMEVSVIQKSVADFLSIELKESNEAARAIKLRKCFEARSEGGKKKFLVMLDDVWWDLDLNDIGLSPLPNQGIDFKVLVTSRDRSVCSMMGVAIDSILDVKVIEATEAQNFFVQFVKISDDDVLDLDLRRIGDDIAVRCHGLPIAIKTVARTLKGKSKPVWEDALSRIKHNDINEVVRQIFSMSYDNLDDEETRSTLLLCGLFPEDFDTPMEDLMRYGWGLRLFRNVDTITEARNRVNSCVERLIDANLLIQSQEVGWIKMHDLVRAFVLDMCSKDEHASVIGDMSKWPSKYKSESCKRISLTCMGMPEFPRDFPRDCKYPNLLLLKLMHGDKLLKFPDDFYEEMRKLEVIAYESMEYPLHFRSLQCSTSLRTLCLHQCSLIFNNDHSPIGNLMNLEVLSFAYSSIYKLPSTIGNLKELKLLDLTNCKNLCVDAGVLENLSKLEEVYMRGVRRNANGDELVVFSKNLDVLEFEFFDDDALPKHLSFERLVRFKISLGCHFGSDQNRHSFKNTLKLHTNKDELLDCRMIELFGKTKVLHLQVNDINDFGDSLGDSSHHHRCSFFNLRVLCISNCANLRYLFTIRVANDLKHLEHLEISRCPVLETVVDIEDGKVEVLKFPALKFFILCELPMLMSLYKGDNIMQLPQLEELKLDRLSSFTSIYQHFLNKEVVMISKLKKLEIYNMEKLKEIWPSQLSNYEVSQLKEITVEGCDSLVNVFPINPILLLHHLEKLRVAYCGSIDVLFNIELGSCAGEIKEGSSNLRSIHLRRLGQLREVWRVKGVNNSNNDLPILGFQAVEYISIADCKMLRNVFTPTTVNLDMSELKELTLDGNGRSRENKSDKSQKEDEEEEGEIIVRSNKDISEKNDDIPNVAFPSYLTHTFHQHHTLRLRNFKGAEVAFEIESSSCRTVATTLNNQQILSLKDLTLWSMERMTHVWKYDWNRFLISQQELKSSFHNLTSIRLLLCDRIKYLFSPLMAKLLSNLNSINIQGCAAIEVVVSNVDDEVEEMATSISSHTNTTFFPHLDTLTLSELNLLKCIDGVGAKYGSNKVTSNITVPATSSVHESSSSDQVGVAYLSFCQYLKTIDISYCNALFNVIPSHAVGRMPKLEKLQIHRCMSLTEIFEIEETVGGDTGFEITIPRSTNNLLELPNLKKLEIWGCNSLKYIFTSSILESLKQLEELEIGNCSAMQVIIVKEEDGITASSKDDHMVVFPRLKYLRLAELPNLKGFFLGKNDFWWPLLDKVEIYGCPQMMIFTPGVSKAPRLKDINTRIGKHSLECGLNFDWTKNEEQQNQFYNSSRCSTAADIIDSIQFPWSFSNLIDGHVSDYASSVVMRKTIFTCNRFYKQPDGTQDIEEAHNVFERTNDEGLIETVLPSDVILSNKKETSIDGDGDGPTSSSSSSCIWKSNPWTSTSNLSNLTKLLVNSCGVAEYVFSYGTACSLVKLQELKIETCPRMEAIVEQEPQDSKTKANQVVSFPCLKSLELVELRSLKGFCVGSAAFQWPSLDTLRITECPDMTVFTNGQSTTPKLKVMETSFGWCEVTEDLNSFIRTQRQEAERLILEED